MTLDEWYKTNKLFLLGVARQCALDAEQWAKQIKNHPWENVTGKAEEGLIGFVINTEDKIGFGVAHTMYYGKYLENKGSETEGDGKYAVCKPAVQHFMPEFDKAVQEAKSKRPQ